MKTVELFIGRFQPIHNGHVKIIEQMNNPMIIIVRGKNSCNDLIKNPLSEEYQQILIKKIFPNISISVSPNGYIPGILGYFRNKGIEVSCIYAGEDRILSYKNSLQEANKKMEKDSQFTTQLKETSRITSSTEVRNAIRNNDYDTFKKLVPESIWCEWESLKKFIPQPTLGFRQWLNEDPIIGGGDPAPGGGGGDPILTIPVTLSSSASVIGGATKDIMLGDKKIVRRKKKKSD